MHYLLPLQPNPCLCDVFWSVESVTRVVHRILFVAVHPSIEDSVQRAVIVCHQVIVEGQRQEIAAKVLTTNWGFTLSLLNSIRGNNRIPSLGLHYKAHSTELSDTIADMTFTITGNGLRSTISLDQRTDVIVSSLAAVTTPFSFCTRCFSP